jgi:heme exporter protein C
MRVTAVLGWLAALALAVGLVLALLVAPRELTQGNVQRIMYLHLPAIFVAYLAFVVAFAASVVYLWKRAAVADWLAYASVEIGVLFTGINIASGAIWGKPTWGTWWTWDARLTSVAVMFVIYVGYLLVRQATDDPERGARFAAVIAIFAPANIPLVHFSVYWWRTLHQPASLLRPGSPSMPPSLWLIVLFNTLAFALLYAYFAAKRVGILRAEGAAVR